MTNTNKFNNKTPIGKIFRKETSFIRITPEHLRKFWLLYNGLLKDGWFEETAKVFKENKDELPLEITTYAISLIQLIKKEKDIQQKYDLFQALKNLVKFLSGELGK